MKIGTEMRGRKILKEMLIKCRVRNAGLAVFKLYKESKLRNLYVPKLLSQCVIISDISSIHPQFRCLFNSNFRMRWWNDFLNEI